MKDDKAVIYIHLPDGLHTYGFCLEIQEKYSSLKHYKNMVDEFIRDMRVEMAKKLFDLFWQSGSHDRYNGYNYFESWCDMKMLKQDMMLKYVIHFAEKWNILCDIDRPKDFPV